MADEIAKASIGLSIDRGALERDALVAAESAGTKAGGIFSSKLSGALGKLGSAGSGLGLPFAGALSTMGAKLGATETAAGGFAAKMGAAAIPTLALAAAATAVGVEAFKLGTEMQAADAAIAAHAGSSTAAAKQIGDAFLDTAGKSTFSGQQMALAFAPVAGQLGQTEGHALSASEALKVMTAASDLAEASGSGLSDATAVLAKTMQLYGIQASGAADASNVLFGASRATGSSVDTIGQAFQRLHAQLGAATPPLAQVGGLLLDLAKHGESGRQGLSALSVAFNGIIAPTAAVTKAQKDLGVSFIDSKGSLLPLSQIIGELQPKIAGMGDAQAAATLKSIGFGGAASKLVETIKAGPAAFDAATAAVSKHGAVADAARQQSSTFEGQIKTLKATAIDLGTKLGEFLIPIITKLSQVIAAVIGWTMKHKAAAEAIGLAIALLVGGPLTILVATVVLVGTHWNTVWNGMKTVFDDVWHAIQTGIRAIVDVFLDMVGTIIDGAARAFGWVPVIGGKLKDAAKHFDEFKTHVDAALGDTNAQLRQAGQEMDAFNQKAAATGSSIRQLSSGPNAQFASGVGTAGGVVRMQAAGGLTLKPELGWRGEAGPELVLPLTNRPAAFQAWRDAANAGFDIGSLIPSGTGGRGAGITVEIGQIVTPDPRQTTLDLSRKLRSQLFLLGVGG